MIGVDRKVNNYNLPQPLKWGPRHNFVVVGRAEHGENSYGIYIIPSY